MKNILNKLAKAWDILFFGEYRNALEREEKMKMLLMEIRGPATKKYLALNKAGIPLEHESRTLEASPVAMQLAKELGFSTILGLKLKQAPFIQKSAAINDV